MPDSLYETDLLAWSHEQAERLRRIAAGERVNDLDWAHVIEEIEGLGASELRAVRSLLSAAILHALKVIGWPDHPAGDHWRGEITNFLLQARQRFEPGMQQHVNPAQLLQDALLAVRKADFSVEPAPLPSHTDLTAAEFRDPTFGARDLLDRLRAAIAPG